MYFKTLCDGKSEAKKSVVKEKSFLKEMNFSVDGVFVALVFSNLFYVATYLKRGTRLSNGILLKSRNKATDNRLRHSASLDSRGAVPTPLQTNDNIKPML